MEAAHATPNVLALAKDPERLARLEEANKLLEEIQKVHTACVQTSCVTGVNGVTGVPVFGGLLVANRQQLHSVALQMQMACT